MVVVRPVVWVTNRQGEGNNNNKNDDNDRTNSVVLAPPRYCTPYKRDEWPTTDRDFDLPIDAAARILVCCGGHIALDCPLLTQAGLSAGMSHQGLD